MPERVYIAIEGPIGVGKTTLARMLRAELGASLLLEIFEENPFLSDFYADRERFAFQTQIFFLLSRYHQQREVPRALARQALISDYTFAKDRLFAHLNLHGDELETYERLHSALAERIVGPDLVLYLRAGPETLLERIALRDRPYERSMSPAYIAAVANAYEEFFAGYQDNRVLTIDTDRLNVVRRQEDLQGVVERIHDALRDAGGAAAIRAVPLQAPAPFTPSEENQGTAPDVDGAIELYAEVLSFQQSAGNLAGALLRLGGHGLAGPQLRSPAARDLPALHAALRACQASLARIAGRVGAPTTEAPGEDVAGHLRLRRASGGVDR